MLGMRWDAGIIGGSQNHHLEELEYLVRAADNAQINGDRAGFEARAGRIEEILGHVVRPGEREVPLEAFGRWRRDGTLDAQLGDQADELAQWLGNLRFGLAATPAPRLG